MEDNSDMVVKGVNGQIQLSGRRITISRKGMMGFMSQGLKGDKEILISQISAIQFKKAGILTNGYIQFTLIGGRESNSGLFGSAKDENSVVFKRKQHAGFDLLRARIMSIMDSAGQSPQQTSNGASEIEALASLMERGLITSDEFEAKKQQLLGL